MGYLYDDFTQLNVTNAQQRYDIGTNSISGEDFIAEEIHFYATQDCYVRFDHATGPQHLIRGGAHYTFYVRHSRIYVVRVTVDGTLDVDASGNIIK